MNERDQLQTSDLKGDPYTNGQEIFDRHRPDGLLLNSESRNRDGIIGDLSRRD